MVSNSKAESLPLSLWAFFRQDPEPMVTWTQPRERQRTTTCMEGTSKYVLISSIIHYKSKININEKSGRVQCVEEIQDYH